MNGDGKKLVFKPRFYATIDEVLDFLQEYNSGDYIQNFLTELNDFIMNKIVPYPESHTEYRWKQTPERMYRRAIFKKKYYVVYKVTPESISFLAFVSAKRDLPNLPIED